MQVDEKRLAPLFALFVEYDALQMSGSDDASNRHRTYKQISLPCRYPITRKEREARRGDGWNPENRGQYRIGRNRPLIQGSTVVVVTIGNQRPAIVLSSLDNVHFVAPLRTVLC